MSHVRSALLASVSAVAFIGVASPAWAAPPPPESPTAPAQLSEIIVTAEKREERLQEVPLAVTAFDARILQATKVVDLTDLSSKSPNVVLNAVPTFPNSSSFSIRGLAYGDVESSFEPTVGVEVDGVYLARNEGATQDIFDLASVQILRGPQGTLYGRNTIGGVVSVTTKRPSGAFGGEVEGTVGDHGRGEFRGAIEAPLIKDVLSARLVVMDLNYGGYLHDLTDGRTLGKIDSWTERLTLQFTPTPKFDAALIVDNTTDHDDGAPNKAATPAVGSLPPGAPDFLVALLFGLPAVPTDGPWDVRYSGPIFYNFNTTGVTLNANWDVGVGKLTAITGYRRYDDHNINEYTGNGVIQVLGAERLQNQHQFSQEIRFASPSDGFLTYVIGGYYLHQYYQIANRYFGIFSPPTNKTQHAMQGDDALAAFGQADFHLTSRLTLTAGGRYSYESKDFTNQPLGTPLFYNYKANWTDFSPKFGIKYDFSHDVMAYVQYSRGFRSGGFNGRAGSPTSAGPYAAEHVGSYEAGFKSELFDHRLRLNADVFDSKYSNIQEDVQNLVPGTLIEETVVRNAASATIYGVEAEAHAIFGWGFSADASLGYLHAKFDSFPANLYGPCGVPPAAPQGIFCGAQDYSILPFPEAPRWNGSLTLNFEHPTSLGTFEAYGTAVYTDSYETSLNALEVSSNFSRRPAATIFNGGISVTTPNRRYRISLWGKNLFNKAVLYNDYAIGQVSALESFEPPRTWGVDLSVKF